MKQRIIIFLIALSLYLPSLLFAQQGADSTSFWQNEVLSARFHYGFVIAHHAYIQNLTTGHTYGFEIDLFNQRDGSKAWHNQYNLPETGFIYIHLNLANPDVLGNADGLLYAINFPFSNDTHAFTTSLRLATGLGWLSKKFNRIDNHKEIAIGSSLNAAIQINIEERIKISQRFSGNFDIGLTHFSNGDFTYPNLGINNASASIGLKYFLTPFKEVKNNLSEEIPANKNIQYDLLVAAGSRAVNDVGQPTFFSSTLSFVALKQVNPKRLLGIGLDIFYDPGLKTQMAMDSIPVHGNLDAVRSGIYIDHEQVVNKMNIIFQVGIYTIDPYKQDGMIYDRLGFKYHFNKKYFANLTLKAHIAKANYIEWGVGMRI